MIPSFAVLFNEEKASLLHRASGGWHLVGDVPFDEPDLAERISYMRRTASRLEPGGFTSKLVIPEDQIHYSRVEVPSGFPEHADEAVREYLETATPYTADQLAYDWQLEGEEAVLAAVSKETLQEAEAFAVGHRLSPVCFVAKPEDPDVFPGEPFFGETKAAAEILGRAGHVERDDAPVELVERGELPDITAATIDLNAAPEPFAAFTSRRRERLAAEAASAEMPEPEPLHSEDEIAAEEELSEPAPPKRKKPKKTKRAQRDKFGRFTRTDQEVAPPLEDIPAEAKPDPVPEDVPAFEEPKPVETEPVFASAQTPKPEPVEPAEPQEASENKRVGGLSAVAAALIGPKRVEAAEPVMSATAEAPAAPKIEAVPSVGTAEEVAAAPSIQPLPAPARAPKSAPRPPSRRVVQRREAEALTIFGARPSDKKEGAKRGIGPGLFVLGMAVLGLVAGGYFLLPRNQATLVDLTEAPVPDVVETAPEIALAAPAEGDLAPALPVIDARPERSASESLAANDLVETPPGLQLSPGLVTDARGPAPLAEPNLAALDQAPNGLDREALAPQGTVLAALAPVDGLLGQAPEIRTEIALGAAPRLQSAAPEVTRAPALPSSLVIAPPRTALAALPAQRTPVNLSDALSPGALLSPVSLTPADPLPSRDPLDRAATEATAALLDQAAAPRAAEAFYAITGVWPLSPLTPQNPGQANTQGAVQFAALDPAAMPEALDPLPSVDGLLPPDDLFDPPQGASPPIPATPEGITTNQGVRVIAGRPPVVPPVRPGSELPPDPLAEIRPLPRPRVLTPEAPAEDTAETGPPVQETPFEDEITPDGIPVLRATDIRPTPRPRTESPAAEAEAEPTETIVAGAASLRPRARPASLATAPTPARVEPRAAPNIPTSASVARQATEDTSLRLSKLNLIGVYGTDNDRRALVRLPSGRFVKVQVGDRVDGGQVSAIGEDNLRYTKGGRNLRLSLPPS